jgi:hypothetical protein
VLGSKESTCTVLSSPSVSLSDCFAQPVPQLHSRLVCLRRMTRSYAGHWFSADRSPDMFPHRPDHIMSRDHILESAVTAMIVALRSLREILLHQHLMLLRLTRPSTASPALPCKVVCASRDIEFPQRKTIPGSCVEGMSLLTHGFLVYFCAKNRSEISTFAKFPV